MAILRTFILSLITASFGNIIVFAGVLVISLIFGLIYNVLKSILDNWFGDFSFLTRTAEELIGSDILVLILTIPLTLLFGFILCKLRYRVRVPGKFWRKRASRKAHPIKLGTLCCCVMIHFILSILSVLTIIFKYNEISDFRSEISNGNNVISALILSSFVCIAVFQFIYWIYAIKHFKSEQCSKCKAVFSFLYHSYGVMASSHEEKYIYATKSPSYTAFNGKLKTTMEDSVMEGTQTITTYSDDFRCECAYCGYTRNKTIERHFYHPRMSKEEKRRKREDEDKDIYIG